MKVFREGMAEDPKDDFSGTAIMTAALEDATIDDIPGLRDALTAFGRKLAEQMTNYEGRTGNGNANFGERVLGVNLYSVDFSVILRPRKRT